VQFLVAFCEPFKPSLACLKGRVVGPFFSPFLDLSATKPASLPALFNFDPFNQLHLHFHIHNFSPSSGSPITCFFPSAEIVDGNPIKFGHIRKGCRLDLVNEELLGLLAKNFVPTVALSDHKFIVHFLELSQMGVRLGELFNLQADFFIN
jgi:hypothetical protein